MASEIRAHQNGVSFAGTARLYIFQGDKGKPREFLKSKMHIRMSLDITMDNACREITESNEPIEIETQQNGMSCMSQQLSMQT